jgi:hypothetical protein
LGHSTDTRCYLPSSTYLSRLEWSTPRLNDIISPQRSKCVIGATNLLSAGLSYGCGSWGKSLGGCYGGDSDASQEAVAKE